jgi:hypothetical protein
MLRDLGFARVEPCSVLCGDFEKAIIRYTMAFHAWKA